jgi:hypothetical protein
MNLREFNEWISHHVQLFPTLQAKLDQYPETLGKWTRLLESVDVSQAKLITDAMADGTIEPPPAYEWDRLPAVIIREAKLSASRQMAAESEPYHKSRGASNVAEAYQAFLDAHDAGKSLEACKKAMADVLGPVDQEQAQRYGCKICWDSGLVSVWHFYSIRAFLSGTIDEPGQKRTMTCPCSCFRGDEFVKEEFANSRQQQEWKGWTQGTTRYHPDRYAALDGNGSVQSEESFANLADFVQRLKAGETEHPYNGLSKNSTVEWEY